MALPTADLPSNMRLMTKLHRGAWNHCPRDIVTVPRHIAHMAKRTATPATALSDPQVIAVIGFVASVTHARGRKQAVGSGSARGHGLMALETLDPVENVASMIEAERYGLGGKYGGTWSLCLVGTRGMSVRGREQSSRDRSNGSSGSSGRRRGRGDPGWSHLSIEHERQQKAGQRQGNGEGQTSHLSTT
jgi:hypothetical protein